MTGGGDTAREARASEREREGCARAHLQIAKLLRGEAQPLLVQASRVVDDRHAPNPHGPQQPRGVEVQRVVGARAARRRAVTQPAEAASSFRDAQRRAVSVAFEPGHVAPREERLLSALTQLGISQRRHAAHCSARAVEQGRRRLALAALVVCGWRALCET